MSEWKSPRSEGFPTPPFAAQNESKSVAIGQIIGGFLSIWIVVALTVYGTLSILDVDVTWQEAGLVGVIYVFFRAWDKITFGRFQK